MGKYEIQYDFDADIQSFVFGVAIWWDDGEFGISIGMLSLMITWQPYGPTPTGYT